MFLSEQTQPLLCKLEDVSWSLPLPPSFHTLLILHIVLFLLQLEVTSGLPSTPGPCE